MFRQLIYCSEVKGRAAAGSWGGGIRCDKNLMFQSFLRRTLSLEGFDAYVS